MMTCRNLCRSAQEKGAQEEAERQAATVKKIKADVARKECIIKAMQTELEKVYLAVYMFTCHSLKLMNLWQRKHQCFQQTNTTAWNSVKFALSVIDSDPLKPWDCISVNDWCTDAGTCL